MNYSVFTKSVQLKTYPKLHFVHTVKTDYVSKTVELYGSPLIIVSLVSLAQSELHKIVSPGLDVALNHKLKYDANLPGVCKHQERVGEPSDEF